MSCDNNSCENIRTAFLDRDWSRAVLEEAASAAEHLRQCPACREAIDQYDELRLLLRVPETPPEIKPSPAVERRGERSAVDPQACRTSRRFGPAVLAASLLVGAAGWILCLYSFMFQEVVQPSQPLVNHRETPPPNDLASPRGSLAQWTTVDVDREVAVFTNISETFDGRTSWVAVGDRATELGLMPASEANPKKLLLLRLLVSQDGREKSKTDLVVVPGQNVNLCVPFEGGQVLHYTIGTTTGKDRRVSLWVELRASGCDGETLAATATQFDPVSGRALEAGRLVTSSGNFALDVSSHEKQLEKAKL